MKKLILSIGLLLGALSLNAGVVYVAPNAVGDSTGSSWDNAMENIQMAINKAKEDETGQTVVWLKAGTYNVTKAIAVKDSVSIYGSFAGTEATADDRAKVEGGKPWEYANPTILNGGDSVNIMNVGKATLLQPVEINGVVFEHGFANTAVNKGTAGGGAIRLNDNASLVNCIIRECKSDKDGGGVRFYGGGSLYYCLFENCYQYSSGNGGGAINASVTNNGNHTIIIEGCEFRGCHSEVRGGAIATNASAGKILINACTFYNNYAASADGTLQAGAVIYDNAANITEITNCVIYNNTGKNCMYLKPGKLNNNTMAFNIGTVYVAAAKNAEVCNNVNWANVTDETGANATGITAASGLKVLGLNNYTYNPIPDGWTVSLDAEVANTNVQFASNKSNGDFEVAEGEEASEGKCLVGPHFVQVPTFFGAIPATTAEENKAVFLAELEAADFHIKRQSALLNAGTDSAFVEVDHDGNNRPQGPRADVGAYELAYHTVVIPAYNAEEGMIADEDATTLNDTTLYAVDGSTMRLYVMTAEQEVPYLVQTVASTNGGLTFDGEKTNVTEQIDKDVFILDLTITAPIMLEVTWVKPIVDYTVTLTVAAGCEEMGTVEGAGTYAAGTEITIKAVAKAGYRFVKWSDENTEAERKIVVTEDLNLTATFEQGEGFADAEANRLAITAEKNGVRVSGLEAGNTVEVFDINGRNVFSTIATSESLFIHLQQGMYIIRQGANRGKAIVK